MRKTTLIRRMFLSLSLVGTVFALLLGSGVPANAANLYENQNIQFGWYNSANAGNDYAGYRMCVQENTYSLLKGNPSVKDIKNRLRAAATIAPLALAVLRDRIRHGVPLAAAIRESVYDLNLTDVFYKKVGTYQGLTVGDGCGSDPSQTFVIVRANGGITIRDARGQCVKSETRVDPLKHTGRHTLIVEACDNGNANASQYWQITDWPVNNSYPSASGNVQAPLIPEPNGVRLVDSQGNCVIASGGPLTVRNCDSFQSNGLATHIFGAAQRFIIEHQG